MSNDGYPEFIKQLPLANVPFKGVKGYLLHGGSRQVVFFEIEPVGEISEHSHGAQWGVVLEGEMELTVSGVTRTCCPGDTYYIPDSAPHSVIFKSFVRALDVFAEADRYQPLG